MAKISQLPAAGTIDGTEQMLGVQGGITKRFSAAQLKGQKGAAGAAGAKGDTGAQGADGMQGADGTPGVNGLSAYQIAVAAGFTGTEPQWLNSLRPKQINTVNSKSTGAALYLHKNHGGF